MKLDYIISALNTLFIIQKRRKCVEIEQKRKLICKNKFLFVNIQIILTWIFYFAIIV